MADVLRTPQQERSRDKLERIYQVSVELLVQGGWEAITVGDVERRSGVSRGAFYLRFPTRQALLDYTRQRLVETVRDDLDRCFDLARNAGATTLDAAVRAAVDAMATLFRRHGPALLRLDYLDQTEGVQDAGAAAMNRLSQEFRSVIEPAAGTDPALRARLEFATEIALSMIVLKLRPRAAFPDHPDLDWDGYLTEVCAALTGYLRPHLPPSSR